ncbi:MAG: hypothetical protein ACM3ZQ_03545 [Bacillota bacterium]
MKPLFKHIIVYLLIGALAFGAATLATLAALAAWNGELHPGFIVDLFSTDSQLTQAEKEAKKQAKLDEKQADDQGMKTTKDGEAKQTTSKTKSGKTK